MELQGDAVHAIAPAGRLRAVIEAVPKTSVGKFDKKVLRKQYADGELEVVTL